MNKQALTEAVKFVARNLILVGLPTALVALTTVQPQYGLAVGIVLSAVDKYIHKLPNEYKGLMPF